MRNIRIWFLLRKLQKACHETEKKHHEHGKETGHNYRACVAEQDFLSDISKGDKKKRAEYADFLELAEDKMKLLSTLEKIRVCKYCRKEMPIKYIRLNSDGLEFVDYFDFVEYVLKKYKLTLALIISIITAFFVGTRFTAIIDFGKEILTVIGLTR